MKNDDPHLSYVEKLLTEKEKADVRAKLPSSVDTIELLKKDLSGYDEDFSYGILTQLGALSLTKDPYGLGFLFARSVLKEVRPGDRIGMMLLVQMLIVYDAEITQAGLLAASKDPEQMERFANIVNKFARTFTHQMDTLHRWRSGPEPRLTVNHVSVSDGGQAIVGPVTQNGADKGQLGATTSPRLITDRSGTAMPIIGSEVPHIEQDQEPAPGAKRRRRGA